MTQQRTDLRNLAIIAHVDHGKTTLVDAMLKQSHIFRDNQAVVERVMDSNPLERERGITILAKNTAVTYGSVKINIVDTPGHADFGGEVERVLNMVDGVLLLVDAVEGPMPQTRFVLRKALERQHKVVVVVNKIDRANARTDYVANATFDLFIDLGATEEQADFPIVYTDALRGQAGYSPTALTPDLQPLFDTILKSLPPPMVEPDGPTQMLVNLLAYDDYKGRIAVGRLYAGRLRRAQEVIRIAKDGTCYPDKVAQVFVHQGLDRVEVEEAEAGEIVAVAGLEEIGIGETIADKDNPLALPPIRVDEPTVQMTFSVNTSPFAGREGRWSSSRSLRERLFKELEHNVSLRVHDTDSPDSFLVAGRGELHLVVLIETMRREGYELQVSRPEVIFQTDPETGARLEPFERVSIEVPEEQAGLVMEMLGVRRGRLVDMRTGEQGFVHYEFTVPTRGLLGFRQAFLTATRGTGLLNSLFHAYEPMVGEVRGRDRGSLVAWEAGIATAYGLANAEGSGILFIGPGTEVYEGMVVGEAAKERDLEVNVAKRKQLTNIRSSTSDIAVRLTPLRQMSLDNCVEYLAEDELLEVTPKSLRLRKRVLDRHGRKRARIARP
ncbi:MAG: translational GTPase TypA [candidate division NC10 bacterium]|nr:translational GTPase TypA [candidate division NC10 bacterium]